MFNPRHRSRLLDGRAGPALHNQLFRQGQAARPTGSSQPAAGVERFSRPGTARSCGAAVVFGPQRSKDRSVRLSRTHLAGIFHVATSRRRLRQLGAWNVRVTLPDPGAEPLPPNPAIRTIPGPVDDESPPLERTLAHWAPHAAILAVVSVVTHDEVEVLRQGDRT